MTQIQSFRRKKHLGQASITERTLLTFGGPGSACLNWCHEPYSQHSRRNRIICIHPSLIKKASGFPLGGIGGQFSSIAIIGQNYRKIPEKAGQTLKETIAVWIDWVYNDSVQESHLFLLEGGN